MARRLEWPRLSAPAASNLDVATRPPGAAGLPDVPAPCRVPASNSSNLSVAKRSTSRRQRVISCTTMISAFRRAGALPVAIACAWADTNVVPAGLGCELIQLLRQISLALVLPRQQPVLIKLAGAGLTQNPLGKRFLQRRRRRNAGKCAAHYRSA